MTILSIILSSLALLAAVFSSTLVLQERKRNQKRNTAFLQYAEKTEEIAKTLDKRIKELEAGTVPDYEKAKEAANAVNNFNAGISGILGFDPYAVLQAQRDQRTGGDTI